MRISIYHSDDHPTPTLPCGRCPRSTSLDKRLTCHAALTDRFPIEYAVLTEIGDLADVVQLA